ncbi:hypothetical protein DXG03_009535 [Asterophora parasitica]|uniref:F-box domain-containing protein n=1 Tax=Asterophora parasitica TaxID=117018 RepID=A0A9P7GAW0_9AGAR|nr:hypothetical protein DXG03_009535 [Asterophora parasitica]
MQEDNQLLWDKVINEAGVQNNTVLSLTESIRAKALLGDAERTLLAMDQEIAALQARRQTHAEQVVKKFHIALAPIKRLTVELLANIFDHFIPDSAVYGKFYDTRRAPWLLGQVCDLWREVSHRDAKLWSVRVNVDDSSLCEILPLAANTRLYAHFVFHRDSIIPILPHIRHLQLNMDITQFKALWKSSGPESFVKLESLNLVIRKGASANAVLLDDQ